MQLHPRSIGTWLGPVLFLLVMWFQPLAIEEQGGLRPGSNQVLAVAVWMITWWVFEAVPLAVTALLPIVLFSMLGVMSLEAVLVSYSDKVLYLFLGGFVLALGLEEHQLHRRIALWILRCVGVSAPQIILGFLLSTALISMWISNTATAVMMLPMAMSCLSLLYQHDPQGDGELKQRRNFSAALLLSIAYGSGIGGMATVIGTPPNLFMRGYFADKLNIQISFFQWMLWTLPIVAVLLLITYVLLSRILFRCDDLPLDQAKRVFEDERERLGKMQAVHWRMFAVFGVTAVLWMTRTIIQPWMPYIPLLEGPLPLSDEAIAIAATISLFLIPGKQPGQALLSWEATRRLPWGILILFGGGIALARALEQTGLLQSLSQLVQYTAGGQPLLLLILLTVLCLYLTEVMSNIAMIQVMVPIIVAIALGIDSDPILFALPATLAASCAFMLPMATPPNGIVFGSGQLAVWDMIRAGFWLNLACLLVILGFCLSWLRLFL